MDDYGRIIEFLPNLRDFPISRDVELGVRKKPIIYSCRCTNINHKGLQWTANEYAEERSVVVNFLKIKNFSKNRKKTA